MQDKTCPYFKNGDCMVKMLNGYSEEELREGGWINPCKIELSYGSPPYDTHPFCNKYGGGESIERVMANINEHARKRRPDRNQISNS